MPELPATRIDEQQDTTGSNRSFRSRTMKFSPPHTECENGPRALPPEILMQILSHLPCDRLSQPTFYACTLVSHSWYPIAIERLYEAPWINSKNFTKFIDTICPSINPHVRTNGFSNFVKKLDMSNLVHDGSKSLTARILGRVKGHLEEFIAPQTSFAINSLAALSKCHNLRHLDLSYVSESLSLVDFIHAISNLSKLETLRLPRTATIRETVREDMLSAVWPPKLSKLYMTGHYPPGLLPFFSRFPPSLTTLNICPQHLSINLYTSFINPLLDLLGPQLRSFTISTLRTGLDGACLDNILKILPKIHRLSITTELITQGFFECASDLKFTHPSPLVELELTEVKRGTGQGESPITSDMIWSSVVDGGLGRLRRLRVHRNLGWANHRPQEIKDIKALSVMLQARAKQDGPQAVVKECDAGVWNFGRYE